MKNIVNSFKDTDSHFDEEKIYDLLYVDYRNISNDYQRLTVTTVNDFNILMNKKQKKSEFSYEYNIKNNFLLKSNVKPESKFLIDKLFKNLKNLNYNLPDEILLCFNGNVENLLDLIYEIVNNDESFTSFTYLGLISFKVDTYKEKTNFSSSNINDTKYQIMFRIVSHESEENYLEIMFQDVSEVVQVEREKAVLNTRSLYLSKIAHEFRNPISAIMELTSNIIESSSKVEENNKDFIVNKASYIDDICRVMSQFLKDYSLFTNLKFPCDKNCHLKKNNLYLRRGHRDITESIKSTQITSIISNISNNFNIIENCPNCGSTSPNYCKKCKLCNNCESNSQSLFDYQELIKQMNENFKKLCKSEKGENSQNTFNEYFLNLSVENQQNLSERNFLIERFNYRYNTIIKTNKELLNSAIYNIIFHCYRSSVNTKADTKVIVVSSQNKDENNEEIITTKFSISNQSVQIDSSFLQFLLNENNKNFYNLGKAQNFNNSDSDKFNKYFELYVAFYSIKKLGSQLKIETGKDGITFFFSIITKKKEIENFIKYDEIKEDCLEFDDTGRTVILSDSHNCIVKPSNIQLKKDSDKSLHSKSTFAHPKISINEEINIEMVTCSRFDTDEKNIKVLIIDDEPLIRTTLKKHFIKISNSQDSKFLVEEASNCFEAINTLYTNFMQNIKFDLIIIDEFMPNMKGSTLIRLFKQLYTESNFYNLKIISYTAFDSDEKKKLILDSGADYILNKPVSFKQFKEQILVMR